MDKLDEIVAHKKQELKSKTKISPGLVRPSTRDFAHFIHTEKQEVAVIAEIKRSTPFRGNLIEKHFDIQKWALNYEEAEAAAISVLTDSTFFKGSLEDLQNVSKVTALPVLRKDFILDVNQIYESRYFGADAILLIVRILSDQQLQDFITLAKQLHMRALVEVHDQEEIDRALKAGAEIIGINNRNLQDGSIDLQITLNLIDKIPQNLTIVSESGIQSASDIKRLQGKVDAVLVGSAIMSAPNPVEKLRELTQP